MLLFHSLPASGSWAVMWCTKGALRSILSDTRAMGKDVKVGLWSFTSRITTAISDLNRRSVTFTAWSDAVTVRTTVGTLSHCQGDVVTKVPDEKLDEKWIHSRVVSFNEVLYSTVQKAAVTIFGIEDVHQSTNRVSSATLITMNSSRKDGNGHSDLPQQHSGGPCYSREVSAMVFSYHPQEDNETSFHNPVHREGTSLLLSCPLQSDHPCHLQWY